MPKPASSDFPLSVKNIIAGILVTVIGGIILAYIIQDARFSPSRINETQTFVPAIPTITITPALLGFKSLNDFSGVFSISKTGLLPSKVIVDKEI